MVRYEIGIVETRNVIKAVLDTYGYDFRDYALTSLKRRLEEIITSNGLRDAEGLISRLQNSKEYFDIFLQELTPETTEMFRDPSHWRALRDEVIPDLKRSTNKPKIWVANYDSGEELYSLAILLKETGLLDNVQIFATVISNTVMKKIQIGKIDARQIEVNEANYARIGLGHSFYHYFNQTATGTLFDVKLIENVSFVRINTLYDGAPGGLRLALFRNQLIYFNQTHQDKVINTISESLVPGGYLALGSKETLENTNINHKFTVVNEAEKIYRKKTG